MLTQLELEFAQIKYRWKMHADLFDDNDNIQLLNRCGSQVFAILQKLLVYDTLAALCRLCDPSDSGLGKENNSIYNQFEKREETLSGPEMQKINELLASLKRKMEGIKVLRNKSISHNDLGVAENATTLPDVTYDEIDEVIDMIGKILNIICGRIGDYETIPAFGSEVHQLLKVLKAGEEKLDN